MWRVLLLLLSASAAAKPLASNTLTGYLESRPQWQPHLNGLTALHGVALGYLPTPNFQLTLKQYFTQDFRRSGDFALENGYVEARVFELWRSEDSKLTVGYRARGYLPMNQFKRDRGLLTILRNYGVVKYTLSPSVRLTGMWIPTVHLYAEDGYTRKKGAHANPYFENRFYFAVDFTLGGGFMLYCPIKISSLRYADYRPGAENNDQWKSRAWLHPLLLYWISPQTAVGAGFSTDTLFGQSVGDAFAKGTAQLVLRAGI